jgi:hypothetical protein
MSGTTTRSLTFSFDLTRQRSALDVVPEFSFTCAALRQKSFPPYLRFCQVFLDSFLKARADVYRFLWSPLRADVAPDYGRAIKTKLDFSTISRNIQNRIYPDLAAFKSDVDLVWQNYIDYAAPDSESARHCIQWQSEFNELWELHAAIRDPNAALQLLRAADDTRRIMEEELCDGAPGMDVFAALPERPRQSQVVPGHIPRALHSERPHEKHRNERYSFRLPSPELLNQPMTIEERYDLAMALDNLPIELLGEVVEILVRAKKIRPDEPIDLSFSELETSTLRMIQACVKYAKDKEPEAKKKRSNDSSTVTAEQKIRVLQAEKRKIDMRLREKRPAEPSGDGTSDGTTSEEGTGTSSGTDDEGSSS